MKSLNLISVILLLFSFACKKERLKINAKDHFFLKNGDAVMPVFVNGNTKSKVFILYLHGGPGSSSLDTYQNKKSPFTMLQKDFAVVNWEQRCSGASQGGCSNLNIAKYVEDLTQLIILMKVKYGNDIKLFLLGQSWGGALGIKYLAASNNQINIKGWIEVDGGHNVPRIILLVKEMITQIGNRQILQGNNAEVWKENINKCNNLDLSIADNILTLNRIAISCEQLIQNIDSVNSSINNSQAQDYFFSPIDFQSSIINSIQPFNEMKNELFTLDLTQNIKQITIPTLLIWGKYDFRVPPTLAKESVLDYASASKELIIFEKSAHNPYWSEPELFYKKTKLFIDANK
jgi:proline iminopeptidase